MIRNSLVLGAAGVALTATVAGAQTESRVGAEVSAGAGYSSNPFTATGGNTGSAVVTADIAPHYQLLTPHSTITATADANIQQYLSHYGHNISYSGALDYQGRLSQRLTAHARVELSSAVLGSYNSYGLFGSGVAGLAPIGTSGTGVDAGTTAGTVPGGATTGAGLQPVITEPLAPYTDVGLYGLRERRRSARASGDLGYALSARDSLSASGFVELTRYGNIVGSDYDAYGGSLGYQRRLSTRLTLGVTGSASSYVYHSIYPDARTYSIQATASATLSDRWTADGALGVSFIDGGNTAGSTSSTSLSGNLNLCRRGAHSTMCLQAVRQASPTGIAGTQYANTVSANWNRQLDERQNVSLGATYSKVGGGQTLLTAGGLPLESEYVQATATYGRRLGQRLRLTASANYRDLLSGYNAHRADIGGQIGLTYSFGDRR